MSNFLEEYYSNQDSDKLYQKWKDDEESKRSLEDSFLYDETDLTEIWDAEFLEDTGESSIDYKSKEYQKFIQDKKDDVVDERAREWFDNRIDEVISNVDYDYEFVEEDVIRVYRKMTVKDIDKFILNVNKNNFGKYSGVGVCWSFNEEQAEAHWAEKGIEILLIGEVKKDFINVENTFWLNMDMSCGPDEAEVRLNEGSKVLIKEIKTNKDLILVEKKVCA